MTKSYEEEFEEKREAIEALKRAARGVFWATGKLEPKISRPVFHHYTIVREQCRRCDDGVIAVLYLNGGLCAWKVEKEGAQCRQQMTCGVDKLGGDRISREVMTREQVLNTFLGIDNI